MVLLIVAGGVALWFLSTATYAYWKYARAGKKTQAHIENWGVEKIGSSKFAIAASYVFEVQGEKFEGKTVFKEPYYLNHLSAEDDLKKWASQHWEVWYDPSSPAFSTLQKLFPYKYIWHALLTLGVFVYFLGMRPYLLRLSNNE